MTEASGESPHVPSGLHVVYPENQIRVLITGWRSWPTERRQLIWDELDGLWARFDIPWTRDKIIIVHGQCPFGGVDLHAENWAKVHRQQWERHPAKRRGGQFLGPERNTEMVNLGAKLCIGFPGPGSRGTVDCMGKAKLAGIETYSVPWVQ